MLVVGVLMLPPPSSVVVPGSGGSATSAAHWGVSEAARLECERYRPTPRQRLVPCCSVKSER